MIGRWLACAADAATLRVRLSDRWHGAATAVDGRAPRRRAPSVARTPASWSGWWAYILVLVPLATDWLESGHPPNSPREYLTEIVVGVIVAACVHRIGVDLRRFRQMADTDPLTGLGNRRRFVTDLEREVAHAHRLGTPLALVLIDVDHFKQINDLLGHAAGDLVLQAVAHRLRTATRRSTDLQYRIGGDEFAVLTVGIDASHIGVILRVGDVGGSEDRHTVLVTATFGAASLQFDDDPDTVLGRADLAMYEAKNGGSDSKITLHVNRVRGNEP